MKKLPSINLSRISFRSFLFSCSLFFACANTHAAPSSLFKILTMGMLFVAGQTQGNNHPEVGLQGLIDSNNSLGIHNYDNEVMNNSNLTNRYTALTGCNNETFSPSMLRLIDSDGNSVECSFEANKYEGGARIRCGYDDLKKRNLILATCDDSNKCAMLPLPTTGSTADKVTNIIANAALCVVYGYLGCLGVWFVHGLCTGRLGEKKETKKEIEEGDKQTILCDEAQKS